MISFLVDLRYGVRMLRRSPGFTAVAVLTLALGIGATSSIFSVVKAIILNPLPFRQPENLVHLWQSDRVERYHRGDQPYFSTVSPGMFYEWRAQSQSFDSISAYRWRAMLFGGGKEAELLNGQEVVDNFFETLGVPAQLGRTFQAADYAPNAPHTVILSYRIWVERFAQDSAVIGKRISLDRESYEIVGVMPPGFYPTAWSYPDLWTAHWANEKEKQARDTWGMFIVARLKPQVTWEQSQTELDVASARIAKNHPDLQKLDAVVVPMDSELIGSSWKLLSLLAVYGIPSRAQLGNSGSIEGVVTDSSGAVVANATVEIANVVSGYARTIATLSDGTFRFTNVPFNPYHLTVTANRFATYAREVEVRSGVPTKLEIALKIGTEATTVRVESGGGLLENDPTYHTAVDRKAFERTPLESRTSPFSSLVTLRSPGVAADSNAQMHALGDHGENSVSLDGQLQTNQFSKVFANQVPAGSIQSMEVISGAPPADYGDKTSLVIKVTTRSGMGISKPTGSVYTAYGSFGTIDSGFDLAFGGGNWGNFIAVNGLDTGRFLDPPEFTVLHDKGNEENIFDRIDYQISQANGIHLNLGFTNPNTYDQQYHICVSGFTCDSTGTTIVNNVTRVPLGATDQRTQIRTFNIAPAWTHLISSNAVFTLGGWVSQDQYSYYPSGNPLNDLAPDLQVETAAQSRKLTNAGARSDVSYVRGIHNIKVGIVYQQTFLTENDHFGIVDPTFNAVCLNADGSPKTSADVTDPTQCGGLLNPGGSVNRGQSAPIPAFNPILACFDLTRPTPAPSDGCANTASTLFSFDGHTDVKELALYAIDNIIWHNWAFNLGIRGDIYRGISSGSQAQPRVGVSYNIKRTNTILRASYARIMETPFNENLVIASRGCSDPVIVAIVSPPGVACNLGALTPGLRNEFHAGFQQAFGKYLVVDAEYIWKYTHNGFDFGIVGATPITFPIEWHNSKIPGWMLRASVPEFHGLTALVVMSSVAARFYNPQVAGIAFFPSFNVFRIDHDEHYNQTTHFQYQPWKRGPWLGFNWRYDSGLVSGAVPCFAATPTCAASTGPNDAVLLNNGITGLPLTADQQFQAGLTCNGIRTAPSPFGPALTPCPANQFASIYLQVPAPGKENDDHNPQRIQPRSLFDVAVGHDNLFRGDRYKWSLRFTVINLAKKVALYNFLSTFSGTHYVTPRTETVELGFHF